MPAKKKPAKTAVSKPEAQFSVTPPDGDGFSANLLIQRTYENEHGRWGSVWVRQNNQFVQIGYSQESGPRFSVPPIELGTYGFVRSETIGEGCILALFQDATESGCTIRKVAPEQSNFPWILIGLGLDDSAEPTELWGAERLVQSLYDVFPRGTLQINDPSEREVIYVS